MSAYTVIADVSETLARVLGHEIQVDPDVSLIIDDSRISLRSPKEFADGSAVTLFIYLYRVTETTSVKSQPNPLNQPVGGRPHGAVPLALDLHYLVTALGGSPREQQLVLGKVLQVFQTRPVLASSDLPPSVRDAGETLRVEGDAPTLEDVTLIWQALEVSLRPSVCYVVRVALGG